MAAKKSGHTDDGFDRSARRLIDRSMRERGTPRQSAKTVTLVPMGLIDNCSSTNTNGIDLCRCGSSGSFKGERLLAQASVDVVRQLGKGTGMIPSASLGHAAISGGVFNSAGIISWVRQSTSPLQFGTEFEIPVELAIGDLMLSPGRAFVLTDASGERGGETEPGAGDRIDFGVDCRLVDSFYLGIEGFYSGTGRMEGEVYGVGLNLRMEF